MYILGIDVGTSGTRALITPQPEAMETMNKNYAAYGWIYPALKSIFTQLQLLPQ